MVNQWVNPEQGEMATVAAFIKAGDGRAMTRTAGLKFIKGIRFSQLLCPEVG